LKAPGFNPCAYKVKPGFKPLGFQMQLVPLHLGRPNIGFPRTHVFKGLKPERATSLPAWWSKEIHGEAGKDVAMPRHTTKPPAIKVGLCKSNPADP
jgi:hypothetical protein